MAAIQVIDCEFLRNYLAPRNGGAGRGALADAVDKLPAASNEQSNPNIWILSSFLFSSF